MGKRNGWPTGIKSRDVRDVLTEIGKVYGLYVEFKVRMDGWNVEVWARANCSSDLWGPGASYVAKSMYALSSQRTMDEAAYECAWDIFRQAEADSNRPGDTTNSAM